MKTLYVLGAIGGCCALAKEVISLANRGIEWYKEYQRMKRSYKRHKTEDNMYSIPIGFRTEKEQREIEAKLKSKREGP